MVLDQNGRQPPEVAVGIAEARGEGAEIDTFDEVVVVAGEDQRAGNVAVALQRGFALGRYTSFSQLPIDGLSA